MLYYRTKPNRVSTVYKQNSSSYYLLSSTFGNSTDQPWEDEGLQPFMAYSPAGTVKV